jgi:hypothetical protein
MTRSLSRCADFLRWRQANSLFDRRPWSQKIASLEADERHLNFDSRTRLCGAFPAQSRGTFAFVCWNLQKPGKDIFVEVLLLGTIIWLKRIQIIVWDTVTWPIVCLEFSRQSLRRSYIELKWGNTIFRMLSTVREPRVLYVSGNVWEIVPEFESN